MRINERCLGEKARGRIRSYDRRKGYGFIYTENREDILFSSYELGRKNEKKVFVGQAVEFEVGRYKDKIVAKNVRLLEILKSRYETFTLPNGEYVRVQCVLKFGMSNYLINNNVPKEEIEELKRQGRSVSDYDYIYVDTATRNYRFFNADVPLEKDGVTDVLGYISLIKEEILEKPIKKAV